MTHRGPFQPLPFCDSVIKWNRIYHGVKNVVFHSTGQLPPLTCLLWPYRSISERFVACRFKHWPASQTKIMDHRSYAWGLSIYSLASFTLWPLEATIQPDYRARNFEQLEEDLTARVKTYFKTREVWGSPYDKNSLTYHLGQSISQNQDSPLFSLVWISEHACRQQHHAPKLSFIL